MTDPTPPTPTPPTPTRPTPGPDRGPVQEPERDHGLPILALVLAALAVLGPLGLWWRSTTTSAAFSDAEVLAGNRLGAARLDVEVNPDRDQGSGTEPSIAGLRATNLAPGDKVSGHIEVANAGTLPLRWGIEANTSGSPELARWLVFELWTTSEPCRPGGPGERLASGLVLGSGPAILVALPTTPPPGKEPLATTSPPPLDPGQSVNLCVGALLPLAAPNTVQGTALDLDLVVNAVHDLAGAPTAGQTLLPTDGGR